MARIRSVHPGQWTDEEFVSCSPWAQLLAIGIRNEADDVGIFEWKPIVLKMRLLPVAMVDINELLAELVLHNIVRRFEDGGKAYGAIRNFSQYQRPKEPTQRYPLPDDQRAYLGLTEKDYRWAKLQRFPAGGTASLVPEQPTSPALPQPLPSPGEIAPQMELESEKDLESPPSSSRVSDPRAAAAAAAAADFSDWPEKLAEKAGCTVDEAREHMTGWAEGLPQGAAAELVKQACESPRVKTPIAWLRTIVAEVKKSHAAGRVHERLQGLGTGPPEPAQANGSHALPPILQRVVDVGFSLDELREIGHANYQPLFDIARSVTDEEFLGGLNWLKANKGMRWRSSARRAA
jgi:hypothetical protein